MYLKRERKENIKRNKDNRIDDISWHSIERDTPRTWQWISYEVMTSDRAYTIDKARIRARSIDCPRFSSPLSDRVPIDRENNLDRKADTQRRRERVARKSGKLMHDARFNLAGEGNCVARILRMKMKKLVVSSLSARQRSLRKSLSVCIFRSAVSKVDGKICKLRELQLICLTAFVQRRRRRLIFRSFGDGKRERRFVEIRYFSKECIFLVRRERRRVGNFEIVHSFSAERRDFRGEKCSSAVAQHARKPRR